MRKPHIMIVIGVVLFIIGTVMHFGAGFIHRLMTGH
jgi:hypothetical protein